MRSRLMQIVAIMVTTSLFSTGCILSRVVDRAFLGITVRRPSFPDRKTTGIFLLPFTFAIDVATFPLQAILVVILGDSFPFPAEHDSMNNALTLNPNFQKLNQAQQATAFAELDRLIRSGQVTTSTALALSEDGHWTLVQLDDEARAQLIARAQQPVSSPPLAICAAP
jgi:hypothetical protein